LIFQKVNELVAFLKDTGIVIGEITTKAYITAANRWQKYNRNRVLMCQRSGMRLGKLSCDKCKSEIKIRPHILTDFLIGALALETKAQSLVTHDSGYFSTYFPELKTISSHQ
jgi:predicted nucleic acid-binding protein